MEGKNRVPGVFQIDVLTEETAAKILEAGGRSFRGGDGLLEFRVGVDFFLREGDVLEREGFVNFKRGDHEAAQLGLEADGKVRFSGCRG
jgi:hypothetical protein